MKSGINFRDASSNTIGHVFLVAVTIILAALAALMFMNFHMPEFELPGEIPVIFEIQVILSEIPDYDSRIVLKNIGEASFDNDLLSARIYINGNPSGCVIETMNGHNFISTHHFGVQTMGGMGCSDIAWKPSEKLALDLTDSTIKKGDLVKVEVIWTPSGRIISADEYHHN
ncbi:MAG: hypothetical protein JW931_04190 [Methanomicrobiaceae archaeon]|nr:hypothetical protein [Methanomicrobiaceae archaeon]